MADHIHEGDMDVVRCPQCSLGLVETETFRATYERRECCDSTEAQWHSRPCAIDGDQGPVGMNDWPPHEKLFAQREMTWAEMAERYPTRGDIEGKTREDLMIAITNPEPPSYMGRMYFASGQRIVQSDWGDFPSSEKGPLRIREDTGSSDRTFENEARLNQRQPIQPKEYWF
jgi:hypothetical protein